MERKYVECENFILKRDIKRIDEWKEFKKDNNFLSKLSESTSALYRML